MPHPVAAVRLSELLGCAARKNHNKHADKQASEEKKEHVPADANSPAETRVRRVTRCKVAPLVEDSKSYPAIYKPFEFGFLVYIIYPLYLPYYLWRTRRFVGLLFFIAFVVLFCLGSLAQALSRAAS